MSLPKRPQGILRPSTSLESLFSSFFTAKIKYHLFHIAGRNSYSTILLLNLLSCRVFSEYFFYHLIISSQGPPILCCCTRMPEREISEDGSNLAHGSGAQERAQEHRAGLKWEPLRFINSKQKRKL